jgi:hypothetical protein
MKFSLFFCATKRIAIQSAFSSFAQGRLWGKAWIPEPEATRNWILSHVSIFVFRGPSAAAVDEYSHDRIAKKSAPMIKSPRAQVKDEDRSAPIAIHTWIGRQAWLFRAGSVAL